MADSPADDDREQLVFLGKEEIHRIMQRVARVVDDEFQRAGVCRPLFALFVHDGQVIDGREVVMENGQYISNAPGRLKPKLLDAIDCTLQRVRRNHAEKN